jgi:hypothetical protein
VTDKPRIEASGGPDPTALSAGQEWEVIADLIGGGDSGTIEVYASGQAFASRWFERLPTRVLPETSIPDPIFVFFNITVSSSCPRALMDALMFDRTARILYGVFTRIRDRPHCGDTASARTFVVAIGRSALPSGRLTIRLEREFSVCADCGRELEQIQIDL